MDQRRQQFFAESRAELEALYLADLSNPYQQSGRSSGSARWVETRKCIAEAIDRNGSFLDVGCANGLLLQTLPVWLLGTGRRIEPYGVDFIPQLVDLARLRVVEGQFWVANAWDWNPPHQFDYVRTNLDYVLDADRGEFVERQRSWVSPGGRLIVCHYRDIGADPVDSAMFLTSIGYEVEGAAYADGVSVAWIDAPDSARARGANRSTGF